MSNRAFLSQASGTLHLEPIFCSERSGPKDLVLTTWTRSKPTRSGRRGAGQEGIQTMLSLERKWWTLLAVCTATFMLLLDITVVNVALPAIQRSLHSSFSDLQWVIDAYSLTLAVLLLTAGVIGDIRGRREVFAIGLAIFTLSSLVCGLSTTPLMLNIARAVQGTGGAVMFATSVALIASAFQGRDRGTAFGIYGAVLGGAVAVGPLVGGALTSGVGWRWIFFVNVPIGVVAVILTLAKVQESRDPTSRRIDWIGVAFFSVSLFTLVLGLIRGNDDGWTSTKILVLFVVSAVTMALFIVTELRVRYPMLDLGLFRRPAMIGVSVTAFTLAASIFALFLYITLYIQDGLGYGPFAAGLRFLPITVLSFIVAPIAGKLTVRIQSRFPLSIGLALCAGGMLLMGTTSSFVRLDTVAPRVCADRDRDRHGQSRPGLCVGSGRAGGAQRDGVGRQFHFSPGGDRHWHRRSRRRVRRPDSATYNRSAQCHSYRARGLATRWRRIGWCHAGGRRTSSGGGFALTAGPGCIAAGLSGWLLAHAQPPDGYWRHHRLCGRRVLSCPGPPARLRLQRRRLQGQSKNGGGGSSGGPSAPTRSSRALASVTAAV